MVWSYHVDQCRYWYDADGMVLSCRPRQVCIGTMPMVWSYHVDQGRYWYDAHGMVLSCRPRQVLVGCRSDSFVRFCL